MTGRPCGVVVLGAIALALSVAVPATASPARIFTVGGNGSYTIDAAPSPPDGVLVADAPMEAPIDVALAAVGCS